MVTVLRAEGWQALVVSGSVDIPEVAVAIAAGALGSLPESSSFERPLETVMTVAAGRPVMTEEEHHCWLTRHRGYVASQRKLARRLGRLSAREREVLEQLAEGHRAADIAILTKLEVSSQLEAVALVRQTSRW